MSELIARLGSNALIVQWEDEISPEINEAVLTLNKKISARLKAYVLELIPAYNSLTVIYRDKMISFELISEAINRLLTEFSSKLESENFQLHKIPVCYDKKFGLDLELVSHHTGLSPEEIIQIHASVEYRVYMLGFVPGFPYLGGMDQRIACPRKAAPRKIIFSGAVGIADKQTGIYPIEIPAGWQIIGRTPVSIFDPDRDSPFLFNPGDLLKFTPITLEEYFKIEKDV